MGTKPVNIINQNANNNVPENDVWERMNHFGAAGIPFFFLTDFKCKKIELFNFNEIEQEEILFNIQGFKNYDDAPAITEEWHFQKNPIPFTEYQKGFDLVKKHILAGDSYLVNYTCATPISTDLSLREIFYLSKAKYKVFYKNKFTFFSPETFVKMADGKISTYPMKGTIDASLPNAEQQILNDKKETAEHHTIVDLLRNDLSQISRNVRVERFRFIDEIKTNGKHLLQVSSEITGDLPDNWKNKIGDILKKMLPAGSISGAPKKKTMEIIEMAENKPRGFYTGIVGLFDGNKLDSGVAIRFIEKTKNGMYFRSGGGITCFSDPILEYQEMIDKVYLTRG